MRDMPRSVELIKGGGVCPVRACVSQKLSARVEEKETRVSHVRTHTHLRPSSTRNHTLRSDAHGQSSGLFASFRGDG